MEGGKRNDECVCQICRGLEDVSCQRDWCLSRAEASGVMSEIGLEGLSQGEKGLRLRVAGGIGAVWKQRHPVGNTRRGAS